jgi:hypothetical protein
VGTRFRTVAMGTGPRGEWQSLVVSTGLTGAYAPTEPAFPQRIFCEQRMSSNRHGTQQAFKAPCFDWPSAAHRRDVNAHGGVAPSALVVADVTGSMPFTPVAKYQIRVVGYPILGSPRQAHYDGMPESIFTDPEYAAVVLTEPRVVERRPSCNSAELELRSTHARTWAYQATGRRHRVVLTHRAEQVLAGACAAAPLATKCPHQASLARARIPTSNIRDQAAQLPKSGQNHLAALKHLNLL